MDSLYVQMLPSDVSQQVFKLSQGYLIQAKLEMFAMLESVVTDEGWNRVKVAHSGFTEAEKYTLELLKIINIHEMHNVSDNEAIS